MIIKQQTKQKHRLSYLKQYLLPVTLRVVGLLVPVPTVLVAVHVYVPTSEDAKLNMVSDGVAVVLPLYFAVLLNCVIICVEAPLLKVHDTDCSALLGDDTVHSRVMVFPVVWE